MNQHRTFLHKTSKVPLAVLLGMVIVMPLRGKAVISQENPWTGTPEREEISQQMIEGEVIRVQGEFVGKDFSQMKDRRYLIETPYGGQWDLHLEEQTIVIGDIVLGDYVQAKVGRDGSPHMIQEIVRDDVQQSVPQREVRGKVDKKEGNILFLQMGDRTEIVQLNSQSALSGDIREGSMVAVQLGKAGYAMSVQEVRQIPGNLPHESER